MIVWRVMQDWDGLFEGACISDEKFKGLHYLSRGVYEPILDGEREDWIELKEPNYCMAKGVECLLFIYGKEVNEFLKKLKHVTDSN